MANSPEVEAAIAEMREATEEVHPSNLDMDTILDSESEGWNPDPGAKLVGTVILVGACDCGGFGSHPLLEIMTDEGSAVAVHGFHEVLRNAIARWEPKPGERVGIKYHGKLVGRGSFEGYENYRMVVLR